MRILLLTLIVTGLLGLAGCEGSDGEDFLTPGNQQESGSGEPALGAANSDVDIGTEADTDGEADADIDGEVDADTDGEADADTDDEVDADTDGEVVEDTEAEEQIPQTSDVSAINTGPESITDVIIMTGQSNALATHSRLELDSVDDEPNPAVYAYNADKGWEVAALNQNWYRYWPIGWESANRNNAAFHAAKEIVKHDPSRVVGIILVAKGDRSIDLWEPGAEMDVELDSHVGKALKLIPIENIKLVLWMQGEADGSRSDYGSKLEDLIGRLRSKSWGSASMRFVCSETKGSGFINQKLMALNDDPDPYTGCAKASDLETDDNIHFLTGPIRTIGRRQAVRYLELQ